MIHCQGFVAPGFYYTPAPLHPVYVSLFVLLLNSSVYGIILISKMAGDIHGLIHSILLCQRKTLSLV